MEYTFELREARPQPCLLCRTTTTRARLTETTAELLGWVWAHLQEQEAMPVGPPFTRVHDLPGSLQGDSAVELEAGIPVDAPVPGGGPVVTGMLPGGDVASTYHIGPYAGLRGAEAALSAWVRRQGRKAAGASWMVYWTDPGSEPDASVWKTEVVIPLLPR